MISIKLCSSSCCPHLHLDLEQGIARITDDFDGEISEPIGRMICLVRHLKTFLDGDENCCQNIRRIGGFIVIQGHLEGKVRIKDNNAQMLIEKWFEIICDGGNGGNGGNKNEITTPLGESVPSFAGSST